MVRKNIFLAEDDSDDRFLAEEIFRETYSEKYTLVMFESGTELISFLEDWERDKYPDLIILDQNMPRMTGKETLTHIKSNNDLKEIPVVIYSTYYSSDFINECMATGAKSITLKPDSYKKFKEMISSFLNLIE